MKKYICVIALMLALTFAVAAFAACGMSNNPKATKKTLEEKDYTVEAIIGDNDLDAQAELDAMSDEMKVTAGELVAVISAVKGEVNDDVPENFIYIYYFKDSVSANKFWNANTDEINGLSETYKSADGFDVRKDGSVVYFGTRQAIGDAM